MCCALRLSFRSTVKPVEYVENYASSPCLRQTSTNQICLYLLSKFYLCLDNFDLNHLSIFIAIWLNKILIFPHYEVDTF